MRSRLPKGSAPSNEQNHTESDQLIDNSSEPQEENLIRRLEPSSFLKDRLYVTFAGVIQSGLVHGEDALSLMYVVEAGPHWKLISGAKTGISQIGSNYSGESRSIVWNMPFELTYETTVLSGWPQIVFILTGTDFWGRSVIRAYGNMHLPCSSGKQEREVQLFKPLPQSVITEICGYLNGTIA